MWANYFKIALRHFRQHLFFSVINVLGLSMGLTAAILLLLFIRSEFSYDRFHQHRRQIYRVDFVTERESGHEISAITTAGVGPSLLDEMPEVKSVVRFSYPRGGYFVTLENKNFYIDNLTYADSSVFQVFSFPLLEGDPLTALAEPYAVVLTQSAAYKIFGDRDPLDKTVRLNDRDLLKVTGVINDPPANSQLQFDALVSFLTLYHDPNRFLDWDGGHDYVTYVLLRDHADVGRLTARFPDFMEKHINYKYRQFGVLLHLQLEPLMRVHLFSPATYDLATRGDLKKIFIFSAIALFILILACLNFMNLSTAGATQRVREVGLRKVMGASRREIISQFMSEAMLISLIAFFLALLFMEVILPTFNGLAGTNLTFYRQSNLPFFPALLLLVLLTALFAGSYPSFFVSRFSPIRIFHGDFITAGRKTGIRNILVVFQFFVSVTLIICTLVIIKQLSYIKHSGYGFDKENVVLIPLNSETSRAKYAVLKNEMLQVPGVVAAGASSEIPGYGFTRNGYIPEGVKDPVMIHALDVDEDFLTVLGIPVIAGHGFAKEPGADRDAFLINETLARQLNWAEPVGKTITRDGRHKVIGVVRDFHFAPLRDAIGPLLITCQPWNGFNYLSVRIGEVNPGVTIEKIKRLWDQTIPGESFNYEYLDQYMRGAYMAERRFSRLFQWFSGLALFIACLGLLGLAAYATAQRRHEIAIRKVMGAGVNRILERLVLDFTKWIMVACVLAVPVAWLLMHRWLEAFAYRTRLTPWPFVEAMALALVIGMATVAYHAVRAANRVPAEGVRYE
jgi:putative ABC transport system permease protein